MPKKKAGGSKRGKARGAARACGYGERQECAACWLIVPRNAFSNTQLDTKAASERRCKVCVAAQTIGHLRTPTAAPELLLARAMLAMAGLLHPRLSVHTVYMVGPHGPCADVLEIIASFVATAPAGLHSAPVENTYSRALPSRRGRYGGYDSDDYPETFGTGGGSEWDHG